MPNPNDLEQDREEKRNPDIMTPEEEEQWNWMDERLAAKAAANREEFERTLKGETTN